MLSNMGVCGRKIFSCFIFLFG